MKFVFVALHAAFALRARSKTDTAQLDSKTHFEEGLREDAEEVDESLVEFQPAHGTTPNLQLSSNGHLRTYNTQALQTSNQEWVWRAGDVPMGEVSVYDDEQTITFHVKRTTWLYLDRSRKPVEVQGKKGKVMKVPAGGVKGILDGHFLFVTAGRKLLFKYEDGTVVEWDGVISSWEDMVK